MPVLGKAVGYTVRGARLSARGGTRVGRWVTRGVRTARHRGGAGEIGMMRLLDLHAASCAGDTLVTMGLAGTIFFNVGAGEARGRVALYLLLTMAPFALVAPIVGPVLDRFRHGRRYALAATMLGRAFLAWLISDYINGFGLFPAAFGVLVLSRAYGVARSAAVPRVLPSTLGLSQAGARASVFGTVAGAVVAPLGVAAFKIGPQWPLRVATIIFVLGMVTALRLPPRADSDPPETIPALFRRGRKVLSGRLVIATLSGGAVLRGVYGFLTLFLAFAIRSGSINTGLLDWKLNDAGAIGFAAGALGAGSFLATAIGTRLRIHRPALLQAGALLLVTALGVLAVVGSGFGPIVLLCLGTALAAGLAKLGVDATIQERIPEQVRASAFAHSETLLMLAWVFGGAVGLIPFGGRVGLIIVTVLLALATVRSVLLAGRLRKEKLRGTTPSDESPTVNLDATTEQLSATDGRPRWTRMRSTKAEAARDRPARGHDRQARDGGRTRRRCTRQAPAGPEADEPTEAVGTRVLPHDTGTRRAGTPRRETRDTGRPDTGRPEDDGPGYHLYRPSGIPMTDDDS